MEKRIHEEFEKLHHFLRSEEADRMTALKEEEKSKSEVMRQSIEEMNRNMSSLSDAIRAIEQEMAPVNISVLHVSSSTHVLSMSMTYSTTTHMLCKM